MVTNHFFLNLDPDSHQTPQNIRGDGIYVSNKLSVSEVTFDSHSHNEHVWVSIKLMGYYQLCIPQSLF